MECQIFLQIRSEMTTKTEDELTQEKHFSCTFCGPSKGATWEAVTDDGVFFVCDKHHVVISEAEVILLERRKGTKDFEFIVYE